MITKLIRNAIKPHIEELSERIDRANDHNTFHIRGTLRDIEYAVHRVMSIRPSDIADKIDMSTIGDTIDPYDIAKNIEIDASDIEIDYAELSRHIAGNLDNSIEEADLEVLANKVVKHIITNTDYRLWKIERKMDLILNHLGIGAEDLLVYANFEKFHSNEDNA
jgi:hypothetical protein